MFISYISYDGYCQVHFTVLSKAECGTYTMNLRIRGPPLQKVKLAISYLIVVGLRHMTHAYRQKGIHDLPARREKQTSYRPTKCWRRVTCKVFEGHK